jgi:hypothetical protein
MRLGTIGGRGEGPGEFESLVVPYDRYRAQDDYKSSTPRWLRERV